MSNFDLMTAVETAELLGINRKTVLRMVQRGELTPATKGTGIRGAYFFDRSEVQKLLADSAAVAS